MPSQYRIPVTFYSLIALAMMLGCSGAASDTVSPSGNGAAAAIAITPSAPSVALGSQLALQAQVQDASGQSIPGATVFWSSSDTTVVSVSSAGVVTGRSIGTAQVAASTSGQSAVVPVTVAPVSVASLSVAPTTAILVVGGSAALQAVAYDASGAQLTGRTVTWASSAPQVATVDGSGNVTGVTAGTASITATCEGKTASAAITVALIPVAAVAVTPGSATLTTGQTASLAATVTDANGNVLSGRTVTWSSASNAVATVSAQGLVAAIGAGTTTITATSEGKTGTATIVVTPQVVPITLASVKVTPATVTLHNNHPRVLSAALSAQAFDSNGNQVTGRTFTWKSSNPLLAAVTSTGAATATVTSFGIATGTVTVTATTSDVSGTSTVTVSH